MESTPLPAPRRWLPRNTLFFLVLLALLLLHFQLMRLGLILRNHDTARGVPRRLLASSFFYGARFDLAIACYLLLPLVIAGHIPGIGVRHSARHRKILFWIFAVAIPVITFLLLAEFEFFREFQTRYNQLAFQYLDQKQTVAGMLWYNYPVIRYLLLCAALSAGFLLLLRWVMRKTLTPRESEPHDRPVLELLFMGILIVDLVIGMRGGLQAEPLRWGNAYHSDNEFVNQMSLNGLFALGRSGLDRVQHRKTSAWLKRMPLEEARAAARSLIVEPTDTLIDPQNRTMLRTPGSFNNSVTLKNIGRKPNVVLVLMESFSARFMGATGSKPDYTPQLNRIAAEGILFDRAFSSGTHTHQGVFSTLLSFPNLPGYEYLMENMKEEGIARQPAPGSGKRGRFHCQIG